MQRLTRLLEGVGALAMLLGFLWVGYGFYLRWIVASKPATVPVIHTNQGDVRLGEYRDGNQVVPTFVPLVPSPTMLPEAVPTGVSTPSEAPAAAEMPVLPPTRLRIPRIGVDYPVIVADDDHLPRFRAVGWYLGSGFPGFGGNVVLFGHLNGVYETFSRLDELKPGDEVFVMTDRQSYRYVVRDQQIVPRDAVEVMAPSRDARVTLLTCAGAFIPLTRDYTERLIVTASLADPRGSAVADLSDQRESKRQ